MAEDKNNEEEKFDFTPEGEGYISLDEARVLAVRTAVASPGDYGRDFRRVTMVFNVVESTETDDHYTVILSALPQGNFDGTPGREQFIIGKDGTIAVRQVLGLPIQTSAQPAGTASKGGGFPMLPVAIGLVMVGAIAAIGAVLALGSSGGDSVPIAAVAPTETPAPTEIPAPTKTLATLYPTPTPVPTITSRPTPTKTPRPTATPSARSYYDKGLDYYEAENWVMAVGEFTKAIQVNPNYSYAHWYRGNSYDNLGQYQTAINDYTKAIQLKPYFEAQLYPNRGDSYDSLGQYQLAINDYTKAIQLDPYYAKTYINRGSAYRNLGQPTLADADKTMACSLDSQYC